MKPTKTYADLLRDLFDMYSKKMKTGEIYEAYENSSERTKAFRLSSFSTGSKDNPATARRKQTRC